LYSIVLEKDAGISRTDCGDGSRQGRDQ